MRTLSAYRSRFPIARPRLDRNAHRRCLHVFFPLFLLGLAGVLAGLEDRTVRQHDPPLNPTGWRDGS